MLRNRGLAALLAAEVVSTTGSMMTWLALPWFVLATTAVQTLTMGARAVTTLRSRAAVPITAS